MKIQKALPNAMAFSVHDDFATSFNQARMFAGLEGRVATLPDIIDARLVTKPDEIPWNVYFTTMSAEYVGLSRAGKPIAIVAHGVGPMATLDGITTAYGHEFEDKDRKRRGGRIPQKEFLKLERGEYGDVRIVDLEQTWNRRDYQFSGHPITVLEIMREPLWQARLGARWFEYIQHHRAIARKWEEGDGRFYPIQCILSMDSAGNCDYNSREAFVHRMKETPDTAIAHLLTIGQLTNCLHQYYEKHYHDRENRKSLASSVSCHEWTNGIRLIGIRGGTVGKIHPGFGFYNYDWLLKTRLD